MYDVLLRDSHSNYCVLYLNELGTSKLKVCMKKIALPSEITTVNKWHSQKRMKSYGITENFKKTEGQTYFSCP